jgi:hypothetical protein
VSFFSWLYFISLYLPHPSQPCSSPIFSRLRGYVFSFASFFLFLFAYLFPFSLSDLGQVLFFIHKRFYKQKDYDKIANWFREGKPKDRVPHILGINLEGIKIKRKLDFRVYDYDWFKS